MIKFQKQFDKYVGMNENEVRSKSVERAMAIMLTATNGSDEAFMQALKDYIAGKITLEEMEANVDQLKYL